MNWGADDLTVAPNAVTRVTSISRSSSADSVKTREPPRTQVQNARSPALQLEHLAVVGFEPCARVPEVEGGIGGPPRPQSFLQGQPFAGESAGAAQPSHVAREREVLRCTRRGGREQADQRTEVAGGP